MDICKTIMLVEVTLGYIAVFYFIARLVIAAIRGWKREYKVMIGRRLYREQRASVLNRILS